MLLITLCFLLISNPTLSADSTLSSSSEHNTTLLLDLLPHQAISFPNHSSRFFFSSDILHPIFSLFISVSYLFFIHNTYLTPHRHRLPYPIKCHPAPPPRPRPRDRRDVSIPLSFGPSDH